MLDKQETLALNPSPPSVVAQSIADANTDVVRPAAVAKAYWQLVRPRIILMVLFTMTVAALAAAPQVPHWLQVIHGLVGAALVIAGAIALNQRIEYRSDALMPRTANRPLPSGVLTRREVSLFGIAASSGGFVYLAALTSGSVTWLAVASWIVYVWIYTPMKMFSAWQTPIGAIAGAMPTLLGAAVAGAPASAMALTLFGILYLWQFPHAMAIAWLYRRQFAEAGLRVATVTDPSGRSAGWLSAAGAAALLPTSLVPVWAGLVGSSYAVAAMLLGLAYLAPSVALLRQADDTRARRLLRVSLIYLPLVLMALLWARLA